MKKSEKSTMRALNLKFLLLAISVLALAVFDVFLGLLAFLFFVIWIWLKVINPLYRFWFDTKENIPELGSKSHTIKEFLERFRFIITESKKENEKISFLVKQLTEDFHFSLDSVSEIVFALDENGKLIFANQNFKSFFKIDDFSNKYFWELIRNYELKKLIQNALDGRISEAKTVVEIERRIFEITWRKSLTQSLLFILKDITGLTKILKMKKELVENVSHELKTPLSSIKGYLETLEEEIKFSENSNHLLKLIEPIKRNTDRLIAIVNDLLTLSDVESEIGFKFKRVNFKDILESIGRIFEKRLNEKGLAFKINIDENLPEFYGDEYRLEQMFINLIDNAVKYTDKGFIEVKISSDVNRNIVITVEDTGIGIPERDLPRIFERFYVVDKSRSRQSGGTGLGLSIVKHIVLKHNGEIKVESKVGQGTKFTIIFPSSRQNQP